MKNNQTARPRWIAGATAIGLLALVAGSAAAVDAPKTQVAAGVEAPTSAGMRAYIDPATGKLRRPTPAELRAESQQAVAARKQADLRRNPKANKANPHVRFSTRANGTVVGEDLDGSFMEELVATKNADGSVTLSHTGKDAAGKVVAPPASQVPALEVK